ncbi:MAG: ABC transporter substrate-binding protein [Candidatus Micrarchaeota archaeon]
MKLFHIIFAVLAFALVLGAGCITPPEQPATQPPANFGSLDTAPPQQLVVAVNPVQLRIITEQFAPYNYEANGTVTGQSTDVVREIMKRLNVSYNIEVLPLSEGYSLATAGPNVAIYSLAKTPEREEQVKWVGPIGAWGLSIYAKKGTNLSIASLDDAKAVNSICVVRGDARQEMLLANNFSNLVMVYKDEDCVAKIMSGEVTLWFGSSDSVAATMKAKGYSESDVVWLYPAKISKLYIAFSKDVPDSNVQQWQQALDSMKADGTYATIMTNWNAGPWTLTASS